MKSIVIAADVMAVIERTFEVPDDFEFTYANVRELFFSSGEDMTIEEVEECSFSLDPFDAFNKDTGEKLWEA